MEFKRNFKTLNNKTGAKIKKILTKMVKNHEKYKSSYFWSNTGSAKQRRSQEFETVLSFKLNGDIYRWEQSLDISCRNFYWKSKIYKNGEKTNIKTINKIMD